MGSAASVSQQTPPALLRDLSPLQVSELLGVGYEPYKENIVYQEVDGAYLSSLKTDADFAMCAALLDITDDQHIKSLTNDLTNFKNKQDPLFGTPPFPTLGVTLLFLQRLKQLYEDQGWTTTELSDNFIKPETAPLQCSFDVFMKTNHSVTPHPTIGLTYGQCYVSDANIFVSHAWKYQFAELIDAIEVFSEENMLSSGDQWSYWIDLFVNDQWNAPNLPYEWWSGTFSSAIGEIGHTMLVLSPWDAPIPLTRAWCLWEILCTITNKADFTVQLSRTQHASFIETLRSDFEYIQTALCRIDVEQSQAWKSEGLSNILASHTPSHPYATFHHTLPSTHSLFDHLYPLPSLQDKDMIFAAVARQEAGFAGVNNQLCALLRDWLARSAKTLTDESAAMMSLDATGDYVEFERGLDPLDDLVRAADLFCEQGKYDDAKEMYERAVKGFEETKGADHLETLLVVNSLGCLFVDIGDLEEAKEHFERALRGRQVALGLDHPDTLHTLNNLGALAKKQLRYQDALELYQKTLAGKENTLGPLHASTLETVHNLANLYATMESWLPAQELFERALEGKENALGEGHPSTLDTVMALGSMWQERGEVKDARELFERAIKGFEQVHGLDHEDTIDAVANLASVLVDLEAYDEAQMKLERVIKAREEKKGGGHSETLSAVYNLGNLLVQKDDEPQAKVCFQRCFEGYLTLYGADHPDTVDAKERIADLDSSN